MTQRMGGRHCALLVLGTLVPMLTMSTGSATVPGSKRAVWAEHNVTVELDHLAGPYSCGDLNRKIHDILAAIGARANMRIDASRCAPDLATSGIAPWVHVIFSLPFEVDGQLAASADMSATERIVRIEPGNPPSIDARDCELLRQLELTLFPQVPIRVESHHLGCHSSAARDSSFSVSLDVLMPAGKPAKAAFLRPGL